MTTRVEPLGVVAVLVAVLSGASVLAAAGRAYAETPNAVAGSARASDEHQARAFFDIGAQAYEQGRYAEAVEAFRNAYQRSPRAGLVFSIAQAHRRAFLQSGETGELAKAVKQYRAYLSSSSTLPRRRDAELALEGLVPLLTNAARSEVDDEATKVSRLMVSTTTPGAVVQIDGGESVTTLPHVATVTPGTHEVMLSAPGHASQTRRVLVPADASFALAVDLQPLPARLSLRGLEGAEVWLDGRLVAGLPMSRLAVSAGAHRLVVREPGRRSYERNLQLMPGSATRIDVDLSHTPQRNASFALLGGSGACLLGSGVLALLSWREQGVARDWVETRSERALQASEAAAYNDALGRRDQYRTAAIGTGLIGAALGVTGALLFGLDTPPLPAAPGRLGEGPAVEEPVFETLPRFDSSGVSLQLRGHL